MKNLNYIIKSFSFWIILLNSGSTQAQDIHFSQFYMMPLQQNPAMAGAVHPMEASLVFKDQWKAVSSPYRTFAMAYHMRYNKKRSSNGFLSAGINFFNDKAGDGNLGTTKGGLSLAYHIKADDDNTIGLGMYGGFFQRKVDFSNFNWTTQFDGQGFNSTLPAGQIGSAASSNFDLGAGLTWTYNNARGSFNVTGNNDFKINAGFAVFHLNRPTYSFIGTNERLPMRFVAHGNAVYSFANTNWAIVPGFMYARQSASQEIYVGTLARYLLSQNSKFTGLKNGAAISFGGYLRARDAIAAKFIFHYAGWAFGVSYDINISSLNNASTYRGGLELSLRFVAPNPFMSSYGGNNSRF